MDSICRFVLVNHSPDPIQTINFVYETKNITKDGPVTEPVYKACIVARGEATLSLGTVNVNLEKDDVFFIIPAIPYTISPSDDFAYMYISFIGIRGNLVMEQFGIGKGSFVFEGFPELTDLWKNGLKYKNEVIDLLSEGLLMQTFAAIGNRVLVSREDKEMPTGNIVLETKKYIDTNFSDRDLSLEKIAGKFSYNKNYISSAFKKVFGMGIREYLNMVRINNACALMEQNYTSIEDIAYLCGYSDRMYFSKVFKEKMGVSPKQHMKKRV